MSQRCCTRASSFFVLSPALESRVRVGPGVRVRVRVRVKMRVIGYCSAPPPPSLPYHHNLQHKTGEFCQAHLEGKRRLCFGGGLGLGLRSGFG